MDQRSPFLVMAGLVPAIHALREVRHQVASVTLDTLSRQQKGPFRLFAALHSWMAGTSPAMTAQMLSKSGHGAMEQSHVLSPSLKPGRNDSTATPPYSLVRKLHSSGKKLLSSTLLR